MGLSVVPQWWFADGFAAKTCALLLRLMCAISTSRWRRQLHLRKCDVSLQTRTHV
jgi:hypothetical protein